MNLRYLRGRVLLKLAKILDRWAWNTTRQAKRDLGVSSPMPLFDRPDQRAREADGR